MVAARVLVDPFYAGARVETGWFCGSIRGKEVAEFDYFCNAIETFGVSNDDVDIDTFAEYTRHGAATQDSVEQLIVSEGTANAIGQSDDYWDAEGLGDFVVLNEEETDELVQVFFGATADLSDEISGAVWSAKVLAGFLC